MGDLEIRQAEEADLPALIRALGREDYLRWALDRQRTGHGSLLVARLADEPVGKVYLRWEEADEPEIQERLPGVPLLNRLQVYRDHRNRGIGTAIILAAEDRLRARGHDRVALGVELSNSGAIRLYERLGFNRWEHGPMVTTNVEYQSDGQPIHLPEIITMYVKDL
jgi:GNAT superfamily N-acetyltransferase